MTLKCAVVTNIPVVMYDQSDEHQTCGVYNWVEMSLFCYVIFIVHMP